MKSLRAEVRGGHLVMDVPTSLPEGTVLALVVDNEGDALDSAERAALDASLERSAAEAIAGKTRPAEDLIAELIRTNWLVA